MEKILDLKKETLDNFFKKVENKVKNQTEGQEFRNNIKLKTYQFLEKLYVHFL